MGKGGAAGGGWRGREACAWGGGGDGGHVLDPKPKPLKGVWLEVGALLHLHFFLGGGGGGGGGGG